MTVEPTERDFMNKTSTSKDVQVFKHYHPGKLFTETEGESVLL